MGKWTADFFAGNWGSLASVAGLVFSILAFVFSKRATKAARQARDSVLSRSLGEDMSGASRVAAEIVTYVGMDRGDMALLRVNELMNHTSYFVARWDDKLSEQSKNNLLSARAQVRSVHEVLTKNAVASMSPKSKAQLVQACQRVSSIFCEEHGTAIKAADREV